MDDGGQRLLDVIEDTNVLETFLKENFPNSGLEESTRFDNVSSSTDSGLVSSAGLDSFVFDGQLLEPLRGAPPHSSHHTHQLSPHVLQQVLHSPSLSVASSLAGGPPPHQLHPHLIHPHHQSHHLPQSNLVQQHHSQQQHLHSLTQQQQQQQHQSPHPTLPSSVGVNLDADCISRGRSGDCVALRNDSDHSLQQQLLLASAPPPPLGSAPPQSILQLHHHHQSHQHHLHQSHPSLQQQQLPSPHLHLQGHHAPTQALLPPVIPTSLPNPGALLQHSHHVQSQQQQLRQQQQRQQQQQQQQRQQSQPPSKSQHQQQTQTNEAPQTSEIPSTLLPIGLPAASTSSGSCPSSSSSTSSSGSTASTPQQPGVTSTSHESPRSVPPKTTTTHMVATSSAKVVVSSAVSSSAAGVVASGAHSHAFTGRVQVVGGPSQVLSSATQLLTPSSLLSGTPLVQPSGATQVISGGSILAGGQVLSAPSVLQTGQMLSSLPSGQVFQSGQLLSNAQVLTNHLLNNSHVITTMGGISCPTSGPIYVTTSALASHIQHQPQAPPPPLLPPSFPPPAIPQGCPMTLLSPTSTSSPSSASSSSSTSVTSSVSFTVPSKSPVASLPRTSPGPVYPATPSPHHTTTSPAASYPSRSPAPSPHASTLRSPVHPPSPAVTPTSTSQSTQTVMSSTQGAHVSTTIVSGVMGNVGMVQSLVPHVGTSNGVVLTPGGGGSVQVAPGIKQVVQGGQLIQIVSSQNNPRQTVAVPHPKPIQPKQPQLLPKPSPQGHVRQPTPPPPGKTLLGSRPSPPSTQQPIMLGTSSQQPTVITGQQNLGSIVLNSSLLQAGLQQPILIPQPNGMQLLVRPAGHPSGPAGQTLLVPMPSQSQVMTSMGKVPQPQTLVIPGSGQTPALVIPQGLAPALGGANMLGATQGTRATQPIIRFVTPQAPLQLQQINTQNGPMLVAVPVGQTALNLPGLFATSNSVRTLAPQVGPASLAQQVAQGTLQLGSSLAPVSLNPIQIPAGGLQMSSGGHAVHFSASLPSSLSTVITTAATTTKTSPEEVISLASTPPSSHQASPSQLPPLCPPQHSTPEAKSTAKKKSKKKKKDKDSREDRGKGKTVSINLNELLKETGIFDENEFGCLGIEEGDHELAVATPGAQPGISHVQLAAPPSSTTSVHCKISSTAGVHVPQPIPSVINQNHMVAPGVSSANPGHLGQPQFPSTASIPTSVCFTLDAHGKLVLGGTTEAAKPHITAIAGSLPQQMVCPSGMNLSTGTYVIGSSDGVHVPVSRTTVPGIPSMGHLVALHPSATAPLGEGVPGAGIMKFDNIHSHLITSKAAISPHCQNETFRVTQNTPMIHTQLDKPANGGSSLITSLLNNPVPPVIGVSAPTTDSTISVHLAGSEKVNILSADGKQVSDFSANGIITSHPSQVPLNNSAVIVSSNYANSFLPGAIISSRSPGVASQGLDVGSVASGQAQSVSCNIINTSKGINTNTMPISMHIIDNSTKSSTFQNQYLTNIKTNIVEPKTSKKSSKKKKKDKEKEPDNTQVSFLTSGSVFSEKNKSSSSAIITSPIPLPSPVLIHNGNININLTSGNAIGINKSDGTSTISRSEAVVINNLQSLSPTVTSAPAVNCVSPVANNITVTSNSIISTVSNSNSSTNVTTVACLTATHNGGPRMPLPFPATHSSFNSSSGIVVQPGQQVKQLLLSPQNQEALKRVHSQIQDLQTKKGQLGEHDKALQQKLIAEYKKIMATGTPIPVSHSSLPLPAHNMSSNQNNSIKYSHSVGHKKIFFTPNPKKGFSISHPSTKQKHYSDSLVKLNDSRVKDCDLSNQGVLVSGAATYSSQAATSTNSESTVFTLASSGSPVVATSSAHGVTQTPSSHSSVQQLLMSADRVSECPKIPEKVSPRHETYRMSSSSDSLLPTSSTESGGRSALGTVASMPIILTSTKATSLHFNATSPVFNHHSAHHSSQHTHTSAHHTPPHTFSQPPTVSQSTQTPPNSVSSQPSPTTPQAIPSSSGGILPAQQASPVNPTVMSFSPQGVPSNISPMRSSFSLPLTRDQLFEHQLKTDQNGALNPDYRTPFKSKTDACKRLIRYHVYNDFGPTLNDLMDNDSQFEAHGKTLLKKFNAMKYKYKSLLLRDSMRRHPSSETVMLYRLFIQEEKMNLEREKGDVSTGKDLSLPPPPGHWVCGDSPPRDTPFPWEENWPHEKVYVVSRRPDPEPSPSSTPPASPAKKDVIDHRPPSLSDPWDEDQDLDEEGQDEGRLEILMDEETDDCRSQDTSEEPPSEVVQENAPEGESKEDRHSWRDYGGTSPPALCKESEVEPDVRTSSDSEQLCRERVAVADDKGAWRMVEVTATIPETRGVHIGSVEDNTFVKTGYSTKENGIDGACMGKLCNLLSDDSSSPGTPLEALQRLHSKATHNHTVAAVDGRLSSSAFDKLNDKYRHERKYKIEQRERRKHDRNRERKTGSPPAEDAMGKSSRKLKIKLKTEEKAIVPPLRIRSDERGCGGLKLTLKKQEGSSAYYRVGEEPGREYRVEQSEDEEDNAFLPVAKSNNDMDPSVGGRQLRNVSVVLEDCLHSETKARREFDDHRSYKRSKRLKSHHSQSQNLDVDRRENSLSSWSSRFVDRWGGQENHTTGFFYQPHQYSLETSLPNQTVCVSSTGQKIMHQHPRNSQRLS